MKGIFVLVRTVPSCPACEDRFEAVRNGCFPCFNRCSWELPRKIVGRFLAMRVVQFVHFVFFTRRSCTMAVCWLSAAAVVFSLHVIPVDTGIGSRMGTAKVVASLTVMAKDMEGLSGTAVPGMDSSASGIPRTRGQARLSRTGRILPRQASGPLLLCCRTLSNRRKGGLRPRQQQRSKVPLSAVCARVRGTLRWLGFLVSSRMWSVA